MATMTRREHIEEIRREVFWIGTEVQKPPRVFNMLQKTVKLLSDELYAKEVHFLMELIQNAEDNEYPEGVDPSLEFVLTYRDITGTGAPATLLVFNNEKGFSAKNMESICSAGLSTKEGNRKSGKIGEKGIGFKSVFKITARPYIFSNGYQIRFSEDPCPHCKIAYMVPEWVEEKPCLSDIKQIYGSDSTLPTTTIILPLKPDKVNPVMQQLSTVHPELLLFLTKIKKLSVREHNESSGNNPLNSISINSETECVARKNIDAESYTVFLSANGNQFDKECSYYMWRQKFPVKEGYRDEKRIDIEEWVITLAFPRGERLQRGTNSPGVYAFLPTEMVTNFPFIIQADFRLASSRETILWGNKWNEGILGCVPSAFVNALMTLVKEENAPVSSLAWMFNFLPVNNSSYRELNLVRDSIKAKMLEEAIVPSETYLEQKFFHKPREVGRLMPAFWNILKKAKKQGVSLNNLSSHGIYVLNSSFDREEYNQVLDFLGVTPVNNDWYAKCIQSTNLVLGVPEDVYSEFLLFLADNWSSKFSSANFGYIPLIKYADRDGNVSLCCINELAQTAQYSHQKVVCVSDHQSWLIGWNREFRCVGNRFFIPANTNDAIRSCYRKEVLMDWLRKSLKVVTLTVYDYAGLLISHLSSDRKLAVAYAHLLYHSLHKNFISSNDVSYLCRNQMPLVDNYGNVSTRRSGVLVPANGSKWVQLIVSNPWREQGFVELGEDYLHPGYFAGQNTPGEEFFEFLKSYVRAADIPDLSPPDAGIPCVYAPLTKTNAFLLLEWIKNLRLKGIDIPSKLLTCIKAGSWLRVSTNGYSCYKPPSESFFLTSSLGEILQNGSVLVDIPLVDHSYYGESIHKYKEELKSIGVMFEYAEACEFIGKRLMSMAASTNNVTKSTALSILNFIKFLVENYLPPASFIRSIESGRWLKTYRGYKSPAESVLFNQEWEVASLISDIPFIDQHYYGHEEILRFDSELKLLGVVVGFNQNYQLVADNLKSSAGLHYLTAEAFLLLLKCMRLSTSSNKLVQALRNAACLKTNCGHRSPGQCFLYDPEWGCLLNVFGDFPIIDTTFYGSTIFWWKVELKKLGVLVDLEEAAIAFSRVFTQKADSKSISRANVLLLLECYRQLKKMPYNFPPEFNSCIREERWLRTGLCGYRSPRECILFGPAWESISPITELPFIDDSDSFYGQDIHEYSKELKGMGVVVKFEDGVEFVLNGLCSFLNPSVITSAHVLALLKCIRILKEKNYPLPDSFLRKVSQKWLKTHAGDDYYSPKECCLFDSSWESCLKRADGPFIDETFYGSEIKLYREELEQIGVAVDVGKLCPLLASHLDFHSDFETIVRIYNFLWKSNWEPDSEAARMIWIPNGSEDGQWVSPGECVLHDKDGLFGSQLNVLEKHYDPKHYDPELLSFFSSTFKVKSNPSVDDYCKLWKVWESSGHALSNSECCVFWRFVKKNWSSVKKNWSSKTQKHLADNMLQLPVSSDSDGILLLNKRDVFIADDLQLKDVFEHSSTHPLFVWYPQPSLPDLPRTELLELYRKIGVCTLSESVKWEEVSVQDGPEQKQVNPGEISVGRGLLKLILGFLAKLELEAKERHEAVKGLLNLNALETAEPISVRYILPFSTGEPVVVPDSQMIRWDKESSKFFTQKIDRSGGQKNLIEYATHFSEAISKGVLWNREEHVSALSELIKCGFLLEFDEAAVGFLMKSKNLEIFVEDEEFLSAAFPSE